MSHGGGGGICAEGQHTTVTPSSGLILGAPHSRAPSEKEWHRSPRDDAAYCPCLPHLSPTPEVTFSHYNTILFVYFMCESLCVNTLMPQCSWKSEDSLQASDLSFYQVANLLGMKLRSSPAQALAALTSPLPECQKSLAQVCSQLSSLQ